MIVQTSVCFHQLLEFLFKPRTVFEGILLPGEAVGYPSLEVLETQADKTFQRVLPTSTSLS